MGNYAGDPQANYQQPPQQGPVYGAANDPTLANNVIRSSSTEGDAYAQRQQENYVDAHGNQVDRSVEVFEDKNQVRANRRYWTTTVTSFILAVLEIILVMRVFFRLLGANQGNGFITFLYNLSHFFVAPFNGIFNDQALGRSVFEISTIVAMLVYALIAWGIISLARVIFAPDLSGRRSFTTTRRSRLS
jgi:YGGT family